MSSMVLLLTSQLRPLSYRLLPCTSSSALWRGRPAYRCQAYLYACRGCLAAYIVQHHRSTERLDWQSRPYYARLLKKKAHSSLLYPEKKA